MHTAAHRVLAIPFIMLLAVSLTAMAAGDEQQWQQVSERYYVFEIGGAKAGWMRDTVERNEQHIRTSTETRMRIGRANVETGIRMSTTFIETESGMPLSMTSTQDMSSQVVEASYEFRNDSVTVTMTQGGRSTTRVQPLPDGKWLTPNAMEQFLKKRHEARPKEFQYRTIDPTSGLEIVSVESKFLREDDFALGDREIPVTVWMSRTSALPVDGIEMYSADNVLVYWEADMGMGKMTMTLSDRAAAMNEQGGPPPELLVSAFSRSNPPLDRKRHAKQVRYVLTTRNGEPLELPTAGAQRVTESNQRSTTLLVDIEDNVAATESEIEAEEYRAASTMVDSDDPLVRKLATRALRRQSDANAMARAEAMRTFVYKHINDKGLETAFASASETARTRTGDCSEHGVLLAAMLRAAGIPARIASGLLYVGESDGEGLFGWHMWTQALIDGRWVDFDATLPTRYTTGHILTGVSSFSDTAPSSDFNSLITLMGNLDIEVHDFDAAAAQSK